MRRYKVDIAGKPYTIDVQELKEDEFYVIVGDQRYDVRLTHDEDLAEAVISPQIVPPTLPVASSVRPPAPETLRPVPAAPQPALPPKPHLPGDGFHPQMSTPMPGTILEILVKPGVKVTRGQPLMILEAMKMKNSLKAPHDATIAEIKVQVGQAVRYGDVLLSFEIP